MGSVADSAAAAPRHPRFVLHFVVTIALVFFTLVHVSMIVLAGFRSRVGAMITGTIRERS
jgi:thiosulfate reductase cytochrome b subunit